MPYCYSCGKDKDDKDFSRASCAEGGFVYCCKQCILERTSRWLEIRAVRYLYLRLRSRMKKIGWDVLTIDSFLRFWEEQEQVCYYCGREFAGSRSTHDPKARTIDRKDNTKGYTLDNIVLCCDRCNRVKSDVFTEEQFLEIAQRYLSGD